MMQNDGENITVTAEVPHAMNSQVNNDRSY